MTVLFLFSGDERARISDARRESCIVHARRECGEWRGRGHHPPRQAPGGHPGNRGVESSAQRSILRPLACLRALGRRGPATARHDAVARGNALDARMHLVDADMLSVSAPGRRERFPALAEWMDACARAAFMSAVTAAEISDGLAKLKPSGAARKPHLGLGGNGCMRCFRSAACFRSQACICESVCGNAICAGQPSGLLRRRFPQRSGLGSERLEMKPATPRVRRARA